MSLRLAVSLIVLFGALAYALFSLSRGRGFGRAAPARRSPAGKAGGTDSKPPAEHRVKQVIRSIPKGRVVTFAVLSAHAGPGFEVLKISREVRGLAGEGELPWWRVVRKEGRRGLVSSAAALGDKQRELLEAEGVHFEKGTFKLAEYQWEP